VGTNIFLDKEAPRYKTGYGVSLGFICLDLATVCVLEFVLKARNKQKEGFSEEDVRQSCTDEQPDKLETRARCSDICCR
jgi:hypothetical protein